MKRMLWAMLLAVQMAMGQPYCTVRTFGVKDRLVTNKVNGMVQDSTGLMWFSSWNGLMCYDGYSFISFRGNPDDPRVLSSKRLLGLGLLLDGRTLWCNTYYRDMYRFDPATCRFERDTTLAQPSNTTEPQRRFEDSQHRIWTFDNQDGLLMHDPSAGTTRRLTATARNAAEHTGCDVPLWMEDRYGTVWCVPTGGTFAYYDERLAKLVPYVLRSVDFGECIPSIQRTFVDCQGNLWLTAPHSLHRVSFHQQYFHLVTMGDRNETRALYYDRQGRLWAGNVANHLTAFDSLYHFQGYIDANGRVSGMAQTFGNQPYYIYEDSRHRKWIACRNDGVVMIDPTGRTTHYRHDDNDPYSLNCDIAYCIDEDTQGRIWVGCYGKGGGLNLVDESTGRVRFLNEQNELPAFPSPNFFYGIRRITHTANGVMLVSTSDGLVTFSDRFTRPADIEYHFLGSRSDDELSLPSNDVMQTIVMRSGRIFVATMAGELCELDTTTLLTSPHILRQESLLPAQGNIQSIQEDRQGWLWIVHENSLERFDPTTGETFVYDGALAGKLTEFTEAQPAVSPLTGDIAVGTMDGVLVFNPATLGHAETATRIVFPYLLYNGDSTPHPIFYADEVTLPSNRRSVTFSFAAIDYASAECTRYAYKLEGLDKEWQYVGTSHEASFDNLPHGRFRLLVKSTDSEGRWQDNVTALRIHVLPTFWESWWAKALYAILAIFFAYWGWHYANMRRRMKVEREISEQKTKLYTDASHRLRTPLTLIGGPVTEVLQSGELSDEAREQLEMVQRNARNMLEMTNNMLSGYMDNTFFVDDEHVPVFGEADETLVRAVEGESPTTSDIRLLVVEDNDDLRQFLHSILSRDYSVITATNGKEGLEKAQTELPDFIITDVTMPVMDGMTMIHEIKQREDICHIPIIVLSAKASMDDKLRGLEMGIDDYITKPFSSVYLKNRVENIINQRRQLQQRIVAELSREQSTKEDAKEEYRLSTPKIVDYDKQFMEKLMAYLEKHVSDSDLRIEDMASAVAMNRTTLFTKLKSITGMSPVDFVRHLRMQRAIEMVAKSEEPFAQIAYSIGFTDQRYFSRVFKKETGMTPSEYRQQAREG